MASTTLPPNYQPDFIIVGGGAAGCVIASRLSEYLPHKQVLLIEAGPTDVGNAAIEEVKDWWHLLGGDFSFIRDYEIVNKPDLKQPRAIVLGGCTSHNTSLSFRSFTKDIKRWETEGVTGWSVETINRCLDNLLTQIKHIKPDKSNKLFGDWVKTCHTALEVPVIDDFNKHIKEHGGFGGAVGYFSVAYDPDTGNRCSASVAYIHPLIKEEHERPNLKVLLEATVTKIELLPGENTVKSIDVVFNDKVMRSLSATNEVILCAGSIDTVQLLLLSGIGPKEKFEHLGIPMQHELLGVGENLQDHPEGSVFWALKEKSPYETVVYSDAGLFLDRTGEGADVMMHSYQVPNRIFLSPGVPIPPGPFPPHIIAPYAKNMLKSDKAAYESMISYAPYAPIITKTHYESLDDRYRELDQFAMQPNTPNPRSRGYITLKSSNPKDHPIIDFKYFSDKEGEDGGSYDLQTLVYGIKQARKVAKAEPFCNWLLEETFPGAHVVDDNELAKAISGASTTVYHPVGTTKMGNASDRMTVVDCKNLKVKGLKGLRICDAGIIPSLTTINPMLTILAISEHGAELIAKEYGWIRV